MAPPTHSGVFTIPRVVEIEDAAVATTPLAIDANGKGSGLFFICPVDATVIGVHYGLAAVTVDGDVTVKIKDVDGTNGDPGATTHATATQALVGADANTTKNTAFDASFVMVKGDRYVLEILGVGTTRCEVQFTNDIYAGYPYLEIFDGSVWGAPLEISQLAALEFSGGVFHTIPGLIPFSSLAQTTYDQNDAVDEFALKWQLPYPVRVVGGCMHMKSAGDFVLALSDDDTDDLAVSISIDKDAAGNSGVFNNRWVFFQDHFDTLANRDYYLSVRPSTTTNSVIINRLTVPATAQMDAIDGGRNFREATRADLGSWTEVPTARPFFSILCAGAGGGLIPLRHSIGLIGR